MVKFNYIDDASGFDDNEQVSVKICGNCLKFTSSKHQSTKSKIRLIGNGQYIRDLDGSINDLKCRTDRSPNMVSCGNLEQIILGHCNPKRALFTTLTYDSDREYDKKLTLEHKQYIQYLRSNLNMNISYISVVEMQKRGTPHFHDILIFPRDIATDYRFLISFTEQSWNYGSAQAQVIYDVIGLVEYMTKDYRDKDAMKLFPKGKKKYFTSRDIRGVERVKMSGSEANQILEIMEPIRQKKIYVTDDDTGFCDEIHQMLGTINEEGL